MKIKKIFNTLNSRQKNFLFLILALILINAVLETVGIAAIIPLIGLITQESFLTNQAFLSNILLNISQTILPNAVYENNSIQNNLVVGGVSIFLTIFILKTIFIISLNFIQSTYVNSLDHHLSKKLYEGYLSLNYIFHTTRTSSNLKHNILTEVAHFTALFNATIVILSEGIILIFIITFLLLYDFFSSLIIFSILAAITLIFFKLTRSKVLSWGKKRMNYSEKVFKNLMEGLESIKEIYILQKPIFFINKFNTFNKIHLNAQRNFFVIQSLMRPIFELVGITILIFLLLILLFKGNTITSIITVLGLFLAASFKLLPSINKILSQIQVFKFYDNSIDRILNEFNIINKNKKIFKTKAIKKFEKHIEFNNVSFFYPNKNIPVIKDASFLIKKGSKYGIKGDSGSGKSTLISLIATLIEPTKGKIKVDGIDLESNNSEWLNNIGYVSQEINLIDDTIEKNIAFGFDEEEIDQKKINKAIDDSQLSNFINQLKEGAKSRVGEKGQMISGGQKQRIGIARALYNEPKIIILDEPTSSLDLKTEKLFMDTIYSFDRDKTVIIVSHRDTALDGCDEIISISNSSIIKTRSKND